MVRSVPSHLVTDFKSEFGFNPMNLNNDLSEAPVVRDSARNSGRAPRAFIIL